MKILTSILILICAAHFSNAQSNSYETLWKTVAEYDANGLPKSALEVVESIAKKAEKDDNKPQKIKALLYKSKYILILEEDAQLKIVQDFEAAISKSESPTKNILENMLATMYWQYFQNHRYQFYNRSKTHTKVDSDFRTWDLETLFEEVQKHFQHSLQNGLILQQTKLSDFSAILVEPEGSKTLRPTLFDLLNHNALQFYKTTENSISKPAYAFEIDDPKLLGSSQHFAEVELASKDTTSLQLQALKIYQDLIQFHNKSKKTAALVDVDIDRLQFVLEHATFENKETFYEQSLKDSSEKWNSNEASGLYDYELASLWRQRGLKYHPKTNPDVQWQLKNALDLCNSVIDRFPKSRASQKCEALKSQLLISTLGLTAETVIPTQSFSKILVNYSNINRLDFEIYKISKSQIASFNKLYKEEEKLSFLKGKSLSKSWTSDLKNEHDYQKHSTEIIVPKLENGHYIILAKVNNKSKTFATQSIQVTDFAIVDRSTEDELVFQIIDRTNGNPIKSVSVNLEFQSNNKRRDTKQLISDSNGIVRLKRKDRGYFNINIDLSKEKQTAYFFGFYSYIYDDNHNKTNYNAFVFTDRSIYRPGQTVYFKSIILESEKGTSKPLVDEFISATLYNVNREKVAELELNSNDYGSVAGEFILPNTGLNGEYHIEIYSSAGIIKERHYFSVEEYKRPKFETQFDPITETYKVNDSVTAKGKALAYAGSTITDAKVVYRVVRNVQYPRWYYWYRPWFQSEPQEITHGETTTNDEGEFDIVFKAIPDQSTNTSSLPIFQYEVTADVTDINGETRSATTTINVGYHSLLANITVENQLDKSLKDNSISIDTKNLNGEFVPAEGSIKVYKLKAPNRVLRKRTWNAPDYQVIPFEEFTSKFPHDSYKNENNSMYWDKGELVLEKSFNTEMSKEIELGNIKKWTSGKYLIVLESKDKFGQAIKEEARTTIFSPKDDTLADQELFSIHTDKAQYNIGDNVELTLGSSAEDLTVTLSIEKNRSITNTYLIQLNNNKKSISIPVKSDDVGGFAVHYSFSAFNSFQSSTMSINVPYPKSELQIETKTFRDKLQPGSDETWSFVIKGPKGDKVSAEILASMYDLSLDQFKPHQWSFNPIHKPHYYARFGVNANRSFGVRGFNVSNRDYVNHRFPIQTYDQLNWFGFNFGDIYRNRLSSGLYLVEESEVIEEISVSDVPNASLDQVISGKAAGFDSDDSTVILRGRNSVIGDESVLYIVDGVPLNEANFKKINESDIKSISVLKSDEAKALYGNRGAGGVIVVTTKEGFKSQLNIKIRKNLQETAFFFPQLQTDEEGHVSFNFTSPEALTKWKLQLLAHTKTMESHISTLESVTQKELMVAPNVPRFLRHGDSITISSKIVNLTDQVLNGIAVLQCNTAADKGQSINSRIQNKNIRREFSIPAKGNTSVSWSMAIPEDLNLIEMNFTAQAGNFSDGEQHTVPILSNRMLVTETLPMWIKGNETRTFTLDKLKNVSSSTLKHHKLTLEMTSNPAWYAVQALPYLMEYPYDCNEQTFSRYYANALASHIANSNPKIQEVFNQWKNADALLSNLEKNEDLKSIIIQETPWLRDAQSESEQKKRIGLLFDLNKMSYELESAKRKLKANQLNNGAWPWFKDGWANRNITQHIIVGFLHLNQLKAIEDVSKDPMVKNALSYLDAEFIKEYDNLKKYNNDVDLSKDHLSNSQLQYLYLRSFIPEVKVSKKVSDIMNYYHGQIKNHWMNKSLYSKGLMTLISYRNKDHATAKKILKSLKENSITSEELGMYWKANTSSWYWYQAPIETQALLIEAFSEAGETLDPTSENKKTVDNLKIWLLKHKQTNQWKSTKATSEAVYALLLQGSDWLSVSEMVDVIVGGTEISPSQLKDVKLEAGTGYYKTSWSGEEITPAMASVELNKRDEGIAWGSLYWQYFEDLDKITSAETPLKLRKKLFKKTNTDFGEEITEISEGSNLQIGDLVRVRIELRSDRDMEFIHMKDMRASGLEPINVLSQYKWQDGLGYYESTKDASTNFFFDYLPKGIYIFEYDLRVTNAGEMSNGITTIQSMYAPEFSSHSEGVRISVSSEE
ncbi:MG2 domain-containing protein [Psychroserpens sp. XS_ASV72]|uniref:alpha-2-macroglobulin family protein n=1 Tax=Psychroserpens sp. XS_ASV72 TaxID=3241293 RepID=UPI003513CE85